MGFATQTSEQHLAREQRCRLTGPKVVNYRFLGFTFGTI
jgi:hypothetical protein